MKFRRAATRVRHLLLPGNIVVLGRWAKCGACGMSMLLCVLAAKSFYIRVDVFAALCLSGAIWAAYKCGVEWGKPLKTPPMMSMRSLPGYVWPHVWKVVAAAGPTMLAAAWVSKGMCQ